jgi:hypothetical protein
MSKRYYEYGFEWVDYARNLWGPNWAICRPTPKNLEKYGNCITKKAYQDAVKRFELLKERSA